MGINGVFKEMLEKVKKPLYNNTATVVNEIYRRNGILSRSGKGGKAV